MSRVALILNCSQNRNLASNWVQRAPLGTRFELKAPTRSLDQSSKMWAMLTELARQLDWHGQRYSADDWKDYMCHALRKARWMPDEDGGMVPIGMRTSDMTKGEMSDLLTLIEAFGARHGVEFADKSAPITEGRIT